MVQRKVVEFLDDLDGTPARATVHFALGERIYAIDLNSDHIVDLEAALEPYIRHARPAAELPKHSYRPIPAKRLKGAN